MTVNEAKGWLIELKDCEETQEFYYADCVIEAFDIAIEALEEIQQYRAIGTVAELKTAMKYVSLAKKHGTVGKTIDSCAEYEAIGTIEEFKALKEKNVSKKPIIQGLGQRYCPVCKCGGADHFYCARCGQKLG